MGLLTKIRDAMSKTAQTLASLLKVVILSRHPSPKSREQRDTIIIMGNGPSLREAIDNNLNILRSYPTLAVNFSALTPDFKKLRPLYYVLADGAFFSRDKNDKVENLWSTLAEVDWPMTLYLPATARKMPELKHFPDNVTVRFYNLTPAEGLNWAIHPLFSAGLAMPRPRNVLIPSIMIAIREGFKKIILIGADHNWSQSLWVTDRNRVVSVQPHFYKDDDQELRRVEELFKDVHLHDVYQSFVVAFRSYFHIKDYTESIGVEVLNATPGSFIDAFPRTTLQQLGREAGKGC